ncbi:MAG TPA: hypothetical protein DCM64_07595 [Gammaproteobacteria bacterium]|nr:DUF6164 family protein [Gammaproteobacteria bacterium]MDP6732401.1 DUF6164 family protein [Gammaproteobacteria bacterium]HAJ76304.1 hypothetical protein [Gammaproteobacteria bacterium]
MSKLLFKMRFVPDDEAQEVRELLDANEIEFFETFAGNWGISLPALWLKNDDQYDFAQQILDDYQVERTARVKKEYELSRQRGEARTMWHSFLDNPIRFIVYVGLAGLVLFLSLRLFLSF